MGRISSSIRTVSKTNGRQRGFRLMPRDTDRLALMGRWYCLSAEHLARAEADPELWSPTRSESQTDRARAEWERYVDNLRHRLSRLKSIEPDAGRNLGPFVNADIGPDGRAAWFTTRIGGTAAALPWTMRSAINPLFAAHSWMAADIGMALEAEGYRVLSERELSTGIDRWGSAMTQRLESTYRSPKGVETKKKPDVAVLAPNGEDYIAIEAERDMSRSVKVYEEKLRAYQNNSAIKAVWYMCSNRTTARRVAEGANRVFGGNTKFPMRLFVAEQQNGFHFLDVPNLPVQMVADLEAMKPQTENA